MWFIVVSGAGLSAASTYAYVSQGQFPVQSGGEHVSAAAAGRRTHGLPKPRPVLRFDAVRNWLQSITMSAQR